MLVALLFVQDLLQHGGDFLGSWEAFLGSGDSVEEVLGYGAMGLQVK